MSPYKILVIPKIVQNLNSVIRLGKDQTSLFENNNVVYQFVCEECPGTYTGQTKRQLKSRIDEHRNLNQKTVVSEHALTYDHNFNFDKTVILDHESNYHKRIVSEMLHIKYCKDSINRQEDTQKLSYIYGPIMRKFRN